MPYSKVGSRGGKTSKAGQKKRENNRASKKGVAHELSPSPKKQI
jgi:hypothetical protein